MNNTALQQEAFDKFSKLKIGALFMDMGTGKTKVALDLINSRNNKVDYVLWICPCSLKNVVLEEKIKWGYKDLDIDIVSCEGIGASDRIYIETLNKIKNHKCVFIIVDESLKIKNKKAKRTQRILNMSQFAEYKLILNGTPISRSYLDLWGQLTFLSTKILDMEFYEFKDNYCEYYTRGKLKGVIKNYVNIPHLISLIAPYIFEADLILETDTKDHFEYYETNFSAYSEYKDQMFLKFYNDSTEEFNFSAFSIKLQRYYTQNSNRLELINELVEKIDDRVIVFVKYLASIPVEAHKITGAEKQIDRIKIINDFKDGKFKVLYITFGCGAFGLNLQFCNNVIFAEQVWGFALLEQAKARVYRNGQTKTVNYYYCYCESVGLENLIRRCIENKEHMLYFVKSEIEKLNKKELTKWVNDL